MRHHGLLLLRIKEMENSFGEDEARVVAATSVGESGGIFIGNDSDFWEFKLVLVTNLLDELGDFGMLGFDFFRSEEGEMVEPTVDKVGEPRAYKEYEKVDSYCYENGNPQIELATH